VAATTAACASRWNIGSPSSAGGSVHTCRGARGALVSTKAWRGFLPKATAWYASPSSMKARELAPNSLLSARISGSDERWFSASE